MANTGLATRCPACGTVFRVVIDQLRVSEGWVRCGRCSDVFNAAESLVDLQTGALRRVQFDPPPRALVQPPADAPHAVPAFDTENFERRTPPPVPTPEPEAFDEPASQPADEPPLPHSQLPVIDSPPSAWSAADAEAALPASPEAAAPQPSFLRRANRAQRWRQPRVRALLALLAVAGVLALVVQVAYVYRDLIGARHAALRPALEAGCALLGCTVGAAHAIDSITVESTGLVRVEKSSIYKLSVALRNRAAIDVALPALDLTLTDVQGKLLARRVLLAGELGASAPALAAGRDLTLQATLRMRDVDTVAGYTVELFYP